ncbi:hypothetical protein WDW89_16805 [Deltaproteobacteria bacterium TL4]
MIDEATKALLKDAAQKLTGVKRRAFEAKTVLELLDGKVRRAETLLGWSRRTIQQGLRELKSGIVCLSDYHHRGNRKTEEKYPRLEQNMRDLVEPYTQVDPKFQTTLAYSRITAKAVYQALIEHKGYSPEELPQERTILTMLNRLGYNLKRVQKTKPQKKFQK